MTEAAPDSTMFAASVVIDVLLESCSVDPALTL
jgi:hypothetical protein